jgi:hypothetical protein
MWPAEIVQQLRSTLPPGYTAGPRVHLGTFHENDVSPYVVDGNGTSPGRTAGNAGDETTVSAWTSEPSVAVEVEPDDEYEYAVHVYDAEREQTLVAAIEIVSPANKDRRRSGTASSQNAPPCSGPGCPSAWWTW